MLLDDNIFILYRGVKTRVVYSLSDGMNRSDYNSPIDYYLTKNGKRILPVHFKYKIVEVTGSWFGFLLKCYLPNRLMVEELKKTNTFMSFLKTDESWVGGTLTIPFASPEC